MAAANPLVTVVIPCFNQGHFLGDALASIRAQGYQPIETVVIDDGSSDGSSDIAEANDVAVIRQANAGLGAARNAGLAAARGEFIIFLDADDELLAGAVESGVAALRAHPNMACVVRRCQEMDSERRTLPTVHTPVNTSDLYRDWLGGNFVWTPGAAVFRTNAIAAIGGFPAEIGPTADYAVYLKLSRSGRVIFDPVEAVRYRQHEGNMSRDPALMLRYMLKALSGERPHVPRQYRQAFHAGRRRWRRYYGEQIVERLRRARRAGEMGRWRRSALWTLASRCPDVLVTHAIRKLLRVARGVPSAPIEPGRFGPEVPPPTRPAQRRS